MRDGDWRHKMDYKEKCDRYAQLGSRDIELRMEVMLSKLIKGQEMIAI